PNMAPPSRANEPSWSTWTLTSPRVTIAKVSSYVVPPVVATLGLAPMNVLLFSMPDAFEHMPALTMRMPNGALSSLAGNVDDHHRVGVADLILAQGKVRETVEKLVRELQPDLVGLSVMTFQRKTAFKVIDL